MGQVWAARPELPKHGVAYDALLASDAKLALPVHDAPRQVLFLDVAPDALATHAEGARAQTEAAQQPVLAGGQAAGTRPSAQREHDSIDQEQGQAREVEVQPAARQDEQGGALRPLGGRGTDPMPVLPGTEGEGAGAAVRASSGAGGRAALVALQAAVAGHFDGLRWGAGAGAGAAGWARWQL